VKTFNLIRDWKLKGYSFILNTEDVTPHWEIAKRKSLCRLCSSIIPLGEKRFVLEVDFDHLYLSTYRYVFVRLYFCQKHTVDEIEREMGIKIPVKREVV